MIWSDYWGALTLRQRAGLLAGILLIAAAVTGLGVWLLHDPYVPVASSLNSEQLNGLMKELDRQKVPYRVGAGADAVTVPQSQVGKARAAMEGADLGIPPNVGLELFKETDFSTTDFAQKINYQRALQGELTRTIQAIAGVRSARVHVILADGGLFKRAAAKASAAVTVAMQPGKALTPSQVHGIQRLVGASVPEIRIDDVVVLDESGTSLTRPGADSEGDVSTAQLELKRQADQYLEGKLRRLLQDLVPRGTASLSVDTVLDERQLRVTTEEPLGTRGSHETEHATGVLVKERQSRHGHESGLSQTASDTAEGDSADWEHEYVVGHRMEQTLSAPGSIKRLSVAVALQGAPADLSRSEVEQLVVNAVGIDRSRGDSVAVLLLPGPGTGAAIVPSGVLMESPPARPVDPQGSAQSRGGGAEAAAVVGQDSSTLRLSIAVLAGVLLAMLGVVLVRRARPPHSQTDFEPADSTVNIEAATARVREWLRQGAPDGRV